jgi:hypothetical protein
MNLRRFVVGLLTLSSICALPAVASSAPLDIVLYTGGDDLREGSYANFYLKLRGSSLRRFDNITSRRNLPNNSLNRYRIDVPALTSASQVEFCEIEHVSQESFPQTADNWNLDMAIVIMRTGGSFPIVLCERTTTHRFEGNTRRLTLQPAR